jgi:hypothetical protein
VYLYRYVFTKGVPAEKKIALNNIGRIPDGDIADFLEQMRIDRENPAYRDNTVFQDKLLWIARGYARRGIRYAEISDTSLVKADQAAETLRQIHAVMPAVTAETGVLLRFLAGIRRTPLTIVRDKVTPNDYLAENLRVLRAVAADPYVAGGDIIGEEINDILELKSVIAALVGIARRVNGFVIRIHAGENDSLRDNVANSIRCICDSLAPGQSMPRVRIGHGLYTSNLQSPRGRRLMEDILAHQVVLEFQITSNVRLNNLSDLERHPLKQYLRAGIRCVQGTDGGALYGTNSIDEELSLEKMLGLSHNELRQMRAAEAEIERESLAVFARKSAAFRRMLADRDAGAVLAGRIRDAAPVDFVLWQDGDKLDAGTVLADRIAQLPREKFPIVVAGGSFNADRHATRLRPDGRKLLDELLDRADPGKVFFVIGHRLVGYERYLADRNRDAFRFSPSSLPR